MKIKILFTIVFFMSFLPLKAQLPRKYYDILLEKNPELQAALKAFQIAQTKPGQVALAEPSLTFAYALSPVETRLGAQRAKISFMQMFPWFGTLALQREKFSVLAKAKYEAYVDLRNRLFLDLEQRYYSLYQSAKEEELLKEKISLLNAYKSLIKTKIASASLSSTADIDMDLQLNQDSLNLEILKEKYEQQRSVLNIFLNSDLSYKEDFPDSLYSEYPDFKVADSMFYHNPKLKILLLKENSAKLDKSLAQKQAMPKFSLGVDYLFIDRRRDMNPLNNGRDAFMPMVSVSIPLFRTKYKNAEREADLQRSAYQFQEFSTLNKLKEEYLATVFQLESSYKLISLYKRQLGLLSTKLALMQKEYLKSSVVFEKLLNLKIMMLDFKTKLLVTECDYNINLAKLNYIIRKEN